MNIFVCLAMIAAVCSHYQVVKYQQRFVMALSVSY